MYIVHISNVLAFYASSKVWIWHYNLCLPEKKCEHINFMIIKVAVAIFSYKMLQEIIVTARL